MNDRIYMSKEGRIKLEKELHRMKYEERPTIVAEIKRTMELGDLSENAEYHAAKEAQKQLEQRIVELQEKLTRVTAVDADKIPDGKVYLFARVLVKDLDVGEEIEYTIAPPDESDPDEDIISVQSPIGKALLGKEEGDVVEVHVPAGVIKYEIKRISRD